MCDKPEVLFSKYFRFQKFDLKEDFKLFRQGDFVANDGDISQNEREGLVIDSSPFTTRSNANLDNIKYFALTRSTFLPNPDVDQEIFVEAKMSFLATGLLNEQGTALQQGLKKYSAGISNVEDDFRLASGSLDLFDINAGVFFSFIFTNQRLYVLYEVQDVVQSLPEGNAPFAFVFPVLSRDGNDPFKDFHRLKIGFNASRSLATWYVDGNPVFAVEQQGRAPPDREKYTFYGSPHEGGKEILLTSLQAGFSTFSKLNDFPAFNSYETVSQSVTLPPNTTGVIRKFLKNLLPLADLGLPMFQKQPNQLGKHSPQTEVVYNGPQVKDGQGAVLAIKFLLVGKK